MTVTYDDPAVTYDDATVTYAGDGYVFDDIHVTTEFAFGSEPLNTAPVWQPVTAYVRGVNIDRGRTAEHSTYSPGSAIIRLDNRDRRFDPEYTAGPFYGDLVPMVPVRITATRAGNTYTVFHGFVTGWPTAYDTANTDAVAAVQCVDATRLLANTILDPVYENVVVSDPSLAIYFPMQPETMRTGGVLGSLPTGIGTWDYNNRAKAPLRGSATFSTVPAPVEVDQSLRYDTTKNAVGTWLAGWEQAAATAYSVPVGTPAFSTDVFFNAPLKTMELWLSSVDGERFGNSGGSPATSRTLVRAFYGDNAGNYESYILIGVNDDATLNTIQYYTDSVGHTDSSLTSPSLTPQSANHIVVTANSTNVLMYLNGSLVYNQPFNNTAQTWSASYDFSQVNLYIYANRFAHVSVYYDTFDAAKVADRYAAGFGYTGELSSARLARTLDDAGWPTAWRDIETGVQTVGAYRPGGLSANNYTEQIGNAEQGGLIVNRDGYVAFTNRDTADTVNVVASFDDTENHLPFTGVSVDANTVQAVRNSVRARYASSSLTVEDASSVAAYGRASKTLDIRLIDDPAVTESIAEIVLQRSKNPRTRIKQLDINLRSDTAALLPVLTQMELMDDVTVAFTPTNVGDPLWRAVRVQGVRHRITGSRWSTRLYLDPGPISTNGPLIVLDDAVYGKLSDGNKLG